MGIAMSELRSIRLPARPSYPQDLRFDGHRVAEDKACEMMDAAGRFQDITPDERRALAALPRLPAPPKFAPRSHRYAGQPTGFDHEGPRAPRRTYGAFHRGLKRD